MALKPDEVKALTFADYIYMIIGYMRRQDNQLAMHREIMYGLYTFTGIGKRKRKQLKDFGVLHAEKRAEKKHIKTDTQAGELVKKFDNAD